MKKLNLNGRSFDNTNTVKIYNLTNRLVYCLDIFLSSKDNEALTWLLTPNTNNSVKVSLRFDGDANRTFGLKFGNSGESFSNPIIYKRDNNSNKTTILLPNNKASFQQEVYMIAGSNHSSKGAEWFSYSDNFDENVRANAHGMNIAVDNMEKDDFILLEVIPSGATNLTLLDKHIANIIIAVDISTHLQLEKNYLHYNDLDETPQDENLGVIYR